MTAHLHLEVTGDPAELLTTRRAQDQVHLPAELLRRLEQRHVVPAPGERLRCLHPGGSSSDDEPVSLAHRRPQRPFAEALLPPGGRIDRARDRQPFEDAADTTLVAADAVVDSSSLPSRTLFANSGSAICARVIATMSAFPEEMISSANAGSLMPPTVNTGSPTAALTWAVRSTRYPSARPRARSL